MSARKPVFLCILDGWGHREATDNNAIAMAKTPVWDRLWNECPNSLLDASSGAVGLPDGQMGNSEVGHTNIGAGRVVLQDLPKINKAIDEGELAKHPRLLEHIAKLKASGGTCHLMGLLSDGGVHSHQKHMLALAKIITDNEVPVSIHAFLDGRDTPPKSAAKFIKDFESELADGAKIATVTGRYFAMDRDQRWDRVEKAYKTLVTGKSATRAPNAEQAINAAYTLEQTDEFVAPTAISDYAGMQDGDSIMMANFRADRAREILQSLIDPDFNEFQQKPIKFSDKLGMVEYSSDLAKMIDSLYPPEQIPNSLGEVISKAGLNQLRISETEKYAHVTFFFNGGSEEIYEGEDRILVPSPKVATYDLQPEMSTPELTDKLVEAINSEKYSLIICNYPNGDMVGHSGVLPAAIKAAEAIDNALSKLETAIIKAGGTMLVTADHGNAEQMVDPNTGQPHTAHTTNLVPFIAVNAGDISLNNGVLSDIAPTILRIMNISQPSEMTGKCLY